MNEHNLYKSNPFGFIMYGKVKVLEKKDMLNDYAGYVTIESGGLIYEHVLLSKSIMGLDIAYSEVSLGSFVVFCVFPDGIKVVICELPKGTNQRPTISDTKKDLVNMKLGDLMSILSTSSSGQTEIVIKLGSKGAKINFDAEEFTLKAVKTVNINSEDSTLKATKAASINAEKIEIKANADVNMKAKDIKIKANMTAGMDAQSINLKGKMLKLN